MHKGRRKRWDIGKALVERGASEAPGERRSWLEAALESGVPSRRYNRAEREEYEAALDQAVADDPDVDAVVRQLRERLG